jgi:hypothetical protein
MTPQERSKAVARLGFTARQARFLVTVMSHSAVCLPRQYTSFAGIVYGQKTRAFFAKLVARGYASTCRCVHNRAVVYHVHGGALYRAIGEPRSRLRRPVSAAAVVPRLMLLDAVFARPETVWLVDDDERARRLGDGVRCRFDSVAQPRANRTSPDAFGRLLRSLSIGVETDGRLVVLYVITASSVTQFRAFLRRLRPLLDALPEARIRVACPIDLHVGVDAHKAAAGRVLDALRPPIGELAADVPDRVEFEVLSQRYQHLLPLAAGGTIPDLVPLERERVGDHPPHVLGPPRVCHRPRRRRLGDRGIRGQRRLQPRFVDEVVRVLLEWGGALCRRTPLSRRPSVWGSGRERPQRCPRWRAPGRPRGALTPSLLESLSGENRRGFPGANAGKIRAVHAAQDDPGITGVSSVSPGDVAAAGGHRFQTGFGNVPRPGRHASCHRGEAVAPTAIMRERSVASRLRSLRSPLRGLDPAVALPWEGSCWRDGRLGERGQQSAGVQLRMANTDKAVSAGLPPPPHRC